MAVMFMVSYKHLEVNSSVDGLEKLGFLRSTALIDATSVCLISVIST